MDNNYEFDQLVEEQFWSKRNMVDIFEEIVKEKCIQNDVIIDKEFDFESEWENIYINTEKGLS